MQVSQTETVTNCRPIKTKWECATSSGGFGVREIVGALERDGETYYRVSRDGSNQHELIPGNRINAEIAFDERNVAARRAAQAAQAQKEQEVAERRSLDGFEQTLSPMTRGKAVRSLTTVAIKTADGKIYRSIRDLIRDRVRAGWRVGKFGLTAPDGVIISAKSIGKLGIAYAEFLLAKKQ